MPQVRPLTGLVLAAGIVTFSASHASATIISGGINAAGNPNAQFIKLTVPFTDSDPDNTVGNDTFDNGNLYGFDEDQNIVLTALLSVDVVPSGPLTLPVGTTVASHYIFFDPVANTMDGYVNFDSDIVAIITSTGNLAASDFLANTGVTYLNPTLRGLEPAQDSVTISGARQIRFISQASTPGDYVRVLTAYSPGAVPEPGTMTLLGLAALAGAARQARRRR